MRIASVNQDSGISPERAKGAAVHLQAMRNAFSQLGCEVDAFDTPEPAALLNSLERRHGRGYGMVYERYALGRDQAARYAARHRIPYVLEINAPLADEAARYRNQRETSTDRENDRFLFGQADCVVAVSRQVADYALSRGARPDRILVCPNGIDTGRFHAGVDGSEVRDRYIPHGAVALGFHGRERPWHGFENLVSAFARLLEQDLPVHLLVVGEGDFKALSGLPESSYSRVGWQRHEDIPPFVAACDILPLTYEPGTPFYFSPLKLMEAMACGVVPVVPDMGDLTMIVRPGSNGLVYPAGHAEALHDALQSVVKDSGLRERLGQRAASDARGYAWTGIARTVLEKLDPAFQPQNGSATG